MDTPDEDVFVTSRFRVVRHSWRGADGRVRVRETIQHPGAVTILPLLDDGRVCLIRNFRVAVGQTLVELPAGTLEPGEDPRETALRELAEETGYRAAGIEKLAEFFMSPGILNERMHLFVATGLTLGETHLDETEQIERLEVSWDEALAMALGGQIQDAKTLVGLLHYDALRQGKSFLTAETRSRGEE